MSETREELETRIAAYIDGQLPPAEAARLEVFLANTDPRLAEEIIGMLADRHHVRSLPRAAAPGDLAGRIMEQVERSALLNDAGHSEHQPRPWWQSRAVIAAGFVVLIGGFAVFVAESVIGPAHTNKPQPAPLASGGAANLPVTSSPSTDRALALGPGAPADAGSESAFQGGKDTASPERPIEAAESKKPAGTLAPLQKFMPAPVKADETSPADVKTEAELQTQLARNQEVLRGGQLAAAKMGYAAVNSPLRALANISAAHSGLAADPVVVTLVARNDQDFTRLRSSLETIMMDDPAAARQQAAIEPRSTQMEGNGQATQMFALRRDVVEPLKYESGKATSATQAAGEKAASDGDKNEHNAGADGKGFGGAVHGAPGTFVDVRPYQYYSADRGTFDSSNDKQAAPSPGAAALTASAAARSSAARQVTGQLSVAAPVCYRVALHPQQLEQLAAQFRVDSITSGRQAYVITPDTDDRPVAQTQDAGQIASGPAPQIQPEQLNQLDQKNQQDQQLQKNWAALPPRNNAENQTGGGPAVPSSAANNSPPSFTNNSPPPPAASSAPAPAAAPSTAGASHAPAPDAAPWVEVIITMQQPPATAAATEK